MTKLVKYVVIGGTVFAGLFMAALIVLVTTIDLNDYKERIAQVVLDETGRTLVFDGDLDLLVFPRFGVKLGGMSLSNSKGFGPEPMVQVASGAVTVQTIPLLMGRVEFGDLLLDGLVLNMGRNANGVANWDDLTGRTPVAYPELGDSDVFALEVEGVHVTNATLLWDDRLQDTLFHVQGLTLTTGKIVQGGVFPVDLKLAFECANPNAKGTISLKGDSSFDFENREYGHMGMRLEVIATGNDIPGGAVSAAMTMQFMALNFKREHAQVTGLELTAYGATTHFDGTLNGITDGVKGLAGVLSLDPCDIKKVMTALGQMPLEMEDPSALSQVGGTVDFRHVPGDITIQSLTADVDGARIVGSGQISAGKEYPVITAKLDVGKLDLDRYLAPDHADKTASAKSAASEGEKDDTVLPVALLRKLDLDINVKVAELIAGKVRMERVVAQLQAKDGLVSLAPFSTETYNGLVEVTSAIDVTGKNPVSRLTAHVEKLDVGALSKDLKGRSDYAGIADFDATLSCMGARAEALRGTLNGKFKFRLVDGVFPGVDLDRMTRETHKEKDKKGKVVASKADSTKFGSISGTGIVKDGVVFNEDLEVKAPGLRAGGHGAISLVSRKIDYMVKAKLVPQAKGQGGKDSDDLFGVMVPIHVTGTLDAPTYWVSIGEYVKALGGLAIDTVGSVLGGVTSAIKGVGSALNETCCGDETSDEKAPRKKFLGIF